MGRKRKERVVCHGEFLSWIQGFVKSLRPKRKQPCIRLFFADRTGLEPATSAVTGRCSNQLNYRSKIRLFRQPVFGVAFVPFLGVGH